MGGRLWPFRILQAGCRWLALAWGVLHPPSLMAQSQALYELTGLADGLPDAHVEALAQDRYGFVWVGTQGGLVRHAGARLDLLRFDPDRPDSIPGNNVTALLAARDGGLWAAIADHGLVRLDGLSIVDRWRPVDQDGPLPADYAWSMIEACDGAIWILYARSGLVRLDVATGQVLHLTLQGLGLPERGVALQLLPAPECGLWMVRADGLWRIHTNPPYTTALVADAARLGLELLLTAAAAGPDRLWIGGRSRVVEARLGAGGSVETVVGRVQTGEPVAALLPTPSGEFWIGSASGLKLVDAQGREQMRLDSGSDPGLPGLAVIDLLAGREGEVWVATARSGLLRLAPGWRGVTAYRAENARGEALGITALSPASDEQSVWLGTAADGLWLLDLDSGRHGPPVAIPVGVNGRTPSVLGVVADRDLLWVLLRRHLVRVWPDTGHHEVIIERDLEHDSRFVFIETDAAGGLWAGLGSELLRIDAKGRITDRWGPDQSPSRRIVDPEIQAVLRGSADHWWVMGRRGIWRLREDGVPEALDWPATQGVLQAMAFDGDRLWVGSESLLQGLRLDGLHGVQDYRFGPAEGLPAGRIHALLPEDERLWILTGVGAARLEPRTGRIRRFTPAEGLRLAEFSPGAVHRAADGRILAGSASGLLAIDPDRLDEPRAPPQVWLEQVVTRNWQVTLTPGTGRRLELAWNDLPVRFEYVGVSYLSPSALRYRIRLTPGDPDGSLTTATSREYGRLAPGAYAFEVQVAGPDNVWSETGDSVQFVLAPPWWRQTPALLAWAFLLLVSMLLALHARRRRRQRLVRLREAEEQRRLADAASAAKSEFVAIVAHEIRTPLQGLLGAMGLLDAPRHTEDTRRMLEAMRHSGRQMKRVVDDLLDLSGIEAGRVRLAPEPVLLPELLEQIIALHAPAALGRGLDLRLRISADLPLVVSADRDRLTQMVGNLLANAVRYTPRGAIELDARVEGCEMLVLSVSDTGPGMDAEALGRVFEPYERLRRAGSGGTGLGLAICRRLAEAMAGRVDVHSVPGRGSRFVVRVPLCDAAPMRLAHGHLLQRTRIVALVPAPLGRVLLRLARRWRLDFKWSRHPGEVASRAPDLVLLAPGRHLPDPGVFARADFAVAWLATEPGPPGAIRVKPPLTESALLSLILDLRLRACGASGREPPPAGR